MPKPFLHAVAASIPAMRRRSVLRSELGFALPLTLVLVALGLLLAIPFVGFASERFKNIAEVAEEEEAYFAADAGIEAMLADLRLGKDLLSPSYVAPTVELNGFTASVSASAPPRAGMVPYGAVFVDPESDSSLNPLPGDSDFLYVIDDVRPFADLQVSWVFTPTEASWQLTIFEGVGTGGSLLANASKNQSPARLTVDRDEIDGGSYTIRFRNKDDNASSSAPFGPSGEPDRTWLRVVAWKDYLITSTAGGVTITVFARQGPGPNQTTSSVHIATWQGPG